MVLITANDIYIFRDISVEPKKTGTSSNFLVWEFRGRAQFPHSFVRNYAETAPFHKIPHKITVFFAEPLAKVLSKNFEPIKS